MIFPGGGVATAEQPFGKAEEWPWKQFAVRLIQQSGAAVLPVYFEGQNTTLFHFVSRYSLTLGLSFLVRVFGRTLGAVIRDRIGSPVSYGDLLASSRGRPMVDEFYLLPDDCAHYARHFSAAC